MKITQSVYFKRILIFIISVCIIISCSVVVSAKQITGTSNDAYRTFLEERYGFEIIIDDSVKSTEGFYKSPIYVKDAELKVLRDIDSAFSMLPDNFVKEVNDYFKKSKYTPKIYILYGTIIENEDADGVFSPDDISIRIVHNGNSLMSNLLHEFGHETAYYLETKNKEKSIENYFIEQNKNSPYKYNENYKRLNETELNDKYYDYYMTTYSSKNFKEDFAELFSLGVMQYRYISSYGNGKIKPLHNKINKMSEVLCEEIKSLKNSKFLLNCMPDAPSKWAAQNVKTAKEKGIIPWNIYGLNKSELIRYDAALIIQPFLYEYISEEQLLKNAGIKKNPIISENFVFDLTDGEDILLLNNLNIMQLEKGRFNPNGKIQNQEAAVILTKIAGLFDLPDIAKTKLKCNDAEEIAKWIKPYVQYVMSIKIMSTDTDNNFNPEKYITYQEFYSSLLLMNNLKEDYDKRNKIVKPLTNYYQNLTGTAISENGWIYYFTYYSNGNGYNFYSLDYTEFFSGKGKIVRNNSSWFEGEWKNGEIWNGNGKILYDNGSWFEGEWKNGEVWNGESEIKYDKNYWFYGKWENGKIWNGNGKIVYDDGSWFEGEWKDGNTWNGNGKIVYDDGSWFEGEWKECNIWNGKGEVIYNNGFGFKGEWKDGKIWNGTGKVVWNDGSWFDGEWKNGNTWNGNGKAILKNGTWFEGEWKNGKWWNGNGKIIRENGSVDEGEIINGVFVK